jgi:hypothetical protein
MTGCDPTEWGRESSKIINKQTHGVVGLMRTLSQAFRVIRRHLSEAQAASIRLAQSKELVQDKFRAQVEQPVCI